MGVFHTYKMAKLVRNSSVENMTSKGTQVVWRTLPDDEMQAHLLAKLQEEAGEAVSAKTHAELADELADLLEIIHTLMPLCGTTLAAVEQIRAAKTAKRGDFSARCYVDVIHCPVGSEWDAYCAQDAVKYPRVAENAS